jgi:hypothetical protein
MPARTYEEAASPEQDMRGVRPAFRLAQALGAVLDAGALLF